MKKLPTVMITRRHDHFFGAQFICQRPTRDLQGAVGQKNGSSQKPRHGEGDFQLLDQGRYQRAMVGVVGRKDKTQRATKPSAFHLCAHNSSIFSSPLNEESITR